MSTSRKATHLGATATIFAIAMLGPTVGAAHADTGTADQSVEAASQRSARPSRLAQAGFPGPGSRRGALPANRESQPRSGGHPVSASPAAAAPRQSRAVLGVAPAPLPLSAGISWR